MRTIRIKTSWKRRGTGAFGQYYQMSPKRGIKLLYAANSIHNPHFYLRAPTKRILNSAHREFALLKQASKSGHAPKPYEIVLVRVHNRILVGIIMQHLDAKRWHLIGRRMREEFEDKVGTWEIATYLRSVFRKIGVRHGDLHTGNILAKTKDGKVTKVYAVDFGGAWNRFI